jgi:hypothetical protein
MMLYVRSSLSASTMTQLVAEDHDNELTVTSVTFSKISKDTTEVVLPPCDSDRPCHTHHALDHDPRFKKPTIHDEMHVEARQTGHAKAL